MTLPFEVNVADVDIGLQANLIDLQNDEMFQARFDDEKHDVWKIMMLFKNIWEKMQLYVTAFLSSYIVESGFSHVFNLLPKAHNELNIV